MIIMYFKCVLFILFYCISCCYSSTDTYLDIFHGLRQHFSKVVLIVKYNFAATKNHIQLHDKIWSKVFERRLYVGPWELHSISELQSDLEFKRGRKSSIVFERMIDGDAVTQGLYAYSSILRGMIHFNDSVGFLYKHDDMIFNLRTLYNLDLTKIWTTWVGNSTNHVKYWGDDMSERNKQNEWWWNYPKILDGAKLLLQDNEIRQGLINCTGSTEIWHTGGLGSSDMLYIPSREENNYKNIMGKFNSSQLYLEIAIPTYLACYAKTAFLRLKICSMIYHDEWSKFKKRCGKGFDAIHPVKIAPDPPAVLDFMREFMFDL